MTAAAHLSPEWIATLDEAAARHPGLPAGMGDLPITIGYLIADGPSWYLVIGADRIRVLAGNVSSPDVSFSTDAATATEILAGRTDPLRAVVDGNLDIGGDPRLLMANRDVLEAVGDLFAAARGDLGEGR
ncbi:MAG: SCP2 sterol-binding domain-containing protein [Acidimicrobiales bacterium]|nr:SCP2 sterol-binding domain-containing protein [Acidimicrobiales bacterium]